MTTASPPPTLSTEEQEQLQQTVEMFEVIVLASPHDCQSLEILKDAYLRLGRVSEMVGITRRLADTYAALGQFSQAMLEYEAILHRDPNNMEAMAAMGEVEDKLLKSGQPRASAAPAAKAPVPEGSLGGGGDDDEGAGINLDFAQAIENGPLMATLQTDPHAAGPRRKRVEGELHFETDGNEPFAKFLIQHRLVAEEIVSSALERVVKKNDQRAPQALALSLVDEIVRRGSVELETLISGILDRSKFAYIPLEYYDVDRSIVKMLPEELTLGRLIVPFDIMSRTLMVAVANPFDGPGKECVQQLLDYNIQWHLASPGAIQKVLAETYRLSAAEAAASSLGGMRLA